MDMMILGETVRHKQATTTTYYGHWTPSQGSSGVGGVEVFLVSTANQWTVKMETKSSDQADSAATSLGSGVSISSTSPDLYKFDLDGAKDLVRYVVTCANDTQDEFLHFQLCQPLWAPN